MPTLPAQLLPMLLQNLPHKTRDRGAQCLYLGAALGLAERPAGAPLREGLLLGVVDHLLSLDVDIKWTDIVDVITGGACCAGGQGALLDGVGPYLVTGPRSRPGRVVGGRTLLSSRPDTCCGLAVPGPT